MLSLTWVIAMYNREVKERFLSEYSSKGYNMKYVGARFEAIGESERLLSKDIAEMSKTEAISVANQLEFLEMGSTEGFLSVVKSYVRWCENNAVFEHIADGFLQISLNDIDPSAFMSKVFFRDEQDFLYAIRKVREFDELQNDVIALIFGWLGLSMDEALDIRDEDIDFETRKIYDRSGVVLVPWISDAFTEILQQYQRAKSAIRQNGTTNYEVIKDLSYDGFIKRVCSANSDKLGTKLPARQVASAIEKMNRQYVALGFASRLSMRNAQRCGGLHRLWIMEQSGFVVDDKKNASTVEEVYGSSKYRKILWQYKHYKRAFNL